MTAIASDLIDRIRRAAAASPDVEVCGLLFGSDTAITAIQPCRNVAADPACWFEIDPAALFAAHRAARTGGPRLIGHYHSHPSGVARPSPRDAASASPDGALWLIVTGDTVSGWRAVADGPVEGRFVPVTLRMTLPLRARLGSATHAPFIQGKLMSVSPVDFASLLCSRLCHDLLSPVGALNNGLELLTDETDEEMRARVFQLLAESARASANKLKFFRLAFGGAGGFGDRVDSREAKTAIEGLLIDNKRTTFNWWVESDQLPKPALKVMLNLALLASEALVRGGTLDVGGEENNGQLEIVVKIEGPRIILAPDLRFALDQGEGPEGVTPRTAAAYMVHSLVAQAGGTLQISEPTETIMIFGAVFRG